ncbi:MAG TPA: hypothetical protein VNL72_00225 [Gammaproteobacteria bacterium]|nr:hypothetical protein [Gammaproteobacteria bacterium]
MSTASLRWRVVFIGVLALGFTACAHKTEVESDLGIKDAPDWVNEGYQALDDKGGRLFHGVGSAPKMPDASLQVATADDRARAEVARILSSFMNVVSQDYAAAAGTAGDQSAEFAISRQIENITRLNLSGVRIIAHWKDKKSGTIYSLAELDLKNFKDSVRAAQDMDPGLRDFLTANVDNIFDRVKREKKN